MSNDEQVGIISERLEELSKPGLLTPDELNKLRTHYQCDVSWLLAQLAWEIKCYQDMCRLHEGTLDTVQQLDAQVKELEAVRVRERKIADGLAKALEGLLAVT